MTTGTLELDRLFPPALQRLRRLPLTRDQLMLLMIAINEFFLGVDTYVSHAISGTIVPREWIPIVFGFSASALLLLAGLIAIRNRPLATIIANVVLLASMVVGVLGAYFHLVRAALPAGPWWQRLTLDLLIWAPPVMGPLAFTLVGLLGISAVWLEDPPDSGTLVLFGNRRLHLPYSKTRAYFFIVSMGILAALVSSVLDHARTGFENPAIWVGTAIGIFGMVVAAAMGGTETPSRGDLYTYIVAMLLLIIIGPIGTYFHVQANLVGKSTVVIERFIRGAPFLAPLLYSNMGILGLIALLDPRENVPHTTN
ncbi:hypothetical protein ARMA_0581 [Ardenticatena maritima]|uniref:Uncharacterized protein n=1 Tax=Ardenticatena maritima TaxID=872965 RepID=A0A0N0RFB7_9CHLR|nr:hypothetical protein [Ardenticatena maritima]KPL87678.1 hypothetical protein SE16_08705 [Ardenticatena maritima]GAP62158.1 hypothetical protein ARMA_0581 [Ardenticatena maritima]